MSDIKQKIMEYASTQQKISCAFLAISSELKSTTARQYLSKLAKEKKLIRIGQGEYTIPNKPVFSYKPSDAAQKLYESLKLEMPYTDFCIYDGSIFSPIQHHLSINNAIYVETNRDAVEFVFSRLKKQNKDVFRQPDSAFIYSYVDLRNQCIIVKALVTEAPLMTVDGIKVPTLEKILVDTQKDADFDYLQGAEGHYMYQMAFDLFTINTQRLKRYARRRGVSNKIEELLNQVNNND